MAEPFRVVLTRDAERYFARADRRTATRLERCFATLEVDPLEGDVRPIQGRPGVWRRRVGDLRVLFGVDLLDRRVTVFAVLPRGDAYKRR